MEVQNLRSLGMGWAWYVNDLSKYLPDADTLADMTPPYDEVLGVAPDVPLSDVDLEPEAVPVLEDIEPYVADMPFPHALPGPAENEQDVDLVVRVWTSLCLNIFELIWSREDLNVRVFQGVRRGGPAAQSVCCRETFDIETGTLLSREFFNPEMGHSVRLPHPGPSWVLPYVG